MSLNLRLWATCHGGHTNCSHGRNKAQLAVRIRGTQQSPDWLFRAVNHRPSPFFGNCEADVMLCCGGGGLHHVNGGRTSPAGLRRRFGLRCQNSHRSGPCIDATCIFAPLENTYFELCNCRVDPQLSLLLPSPYPEVGRVPVRSSFRRLSIVDGPDLEGRFAAGLGATRVTRRDTDFIRRVEV